MSSLPLKQSIPFSQFDQLREAREIIRQEADALTGIARNLDTRFCEAVELFEECRGRVIVTGIGKAGWIAQKLTATLNSTGTRALFLHPAEAVHGDLGGVGSEDVVLVLSNSGETEEVTRLLPVFQQFEVPVVALTRSSDSTLGKAADVVLELGRIQEAGELGLAPSSTTTAMLAVGDALALVVSRSKGFTASDFGLFHPGGSLGKQLTPVRNVMRDGSELRIADQHETIRNTLQRLRSTGRRTGALLAVEPDGTLAGIFTDSDLAKLLEQHRDEQLDQPLEQAMTRNPTTIRADARLSDAVTLLTDRKISELPVVDEDGKLVGLIDITDVIGLSPRS